MKRHLLIVLRTCTTVGMVHNSGSGRYIDVPKHQLVLTCVSSLINSINQVQGHDVELVVLDDHSSSQAVEDIKKILSFKYYKYNLLYKIIKFCVFVSY